MRQLMTIIPAMIFMSLSVGASTLQGVVVKDVTGGQPVAGVEITSPGANPRVTGDDGQFTLRFPRRNPGDMVRVLVKKDGYRVVNAFFLEQVVLRTHPKTTLPFVVVICEEAKYEKIALNYLRSLIQVSLDRTFDDLEQRRAAERILDKAAETLARRSGANTEFYEQQMTFVIQGHPERALKLNKRVSIANASIKIGDSKFDYDNMEEARHFYEAGLMSFEKLAADSPEFLPNVAEALSKLGDVFAREAEKQQFRCPKNDGEKEIPCAKEDARKNYKESLEIRRSLVKKDREEYLPYLAASLWKLADLDVNVQNPQEAAGLLREDLDLYLELAGSFPDIYQPKVIEIRELLAALRSVE